MSGFRRMTTSLIKIHQGQLIGTVSKNLDGKDFYSFRGIPYARPPLGKLRFQVQKLSYYLDIETFFEGSTTTFTLERSF